jgi:hypothetical protein
MTNLRRHAEPQTQRAVESDSFSHFVGAQCDRADPLDHGQNSSIHFPAPLAQAPDWQLAQDAHRVGRSFRFRNFRKVLTFLPNICELTRV